MSDSDSAGNKDGGDRDHAWLARLTAADRAEALKAEAAARRAEERAEERALQRALQLKTEARRRERSNTGAGARPSPAAATTERRVVFVPRRQRRRQMQQQPKEGDPESKEGDEAAAAGNNGGGATSSTANGGVAPRSSSSNRSTHHRGAAPVNGGSTRNRHRHRQSEDPAAARNDGSANPSSTFGADGPGAVVILSERERLAVRQTYLGKRAAAAAVPSDERKPKSGGGGNANKKRTTFKFRWDNTDDTFPEDDPLYASMLPAASASSAPREDRAARGNNNKQPHNKQPPAARWADRIMAAGHVATVRSASTKPLADMTARDWRIFRENYSITVRGGRAPPPMRHFDEPPLAALPQLHPALLDAIRHVLQFREPSPIQRQAIPIGLQRRDLIGIAETGSGKTIAFGVPLCHYLLNLPDAALQSVADQGPLALVMAPTRELALQIDGELQKLLSRQSAVQVAAVVGGQPIQQQAQIIRQGVHIVVGTPGRINDCIEQAYLVLNQCCYIVMDEADRMVDMGFLPQMESILDAMGGAMKSEDEKETYRQEMEDLKSTGVARHRLTAMFSATMPLEVERIAKRYLRHPSIISIGDKDSGKNARIHQQLVWLPSPAKKEDALRNLLQDRRFVREKIIVFVNEKKHADGVGRTVERAGRQCVVLHGGKSQEQREENLAAFRRGGMVLVATDVAGRGLDIPDVGLVINYDLPTRNIENYTHRIGRTGRAGKEGYATSLITDEDEGIMAPLKAYLESTGNEVPARLARHPAVNSGATGPNSVMY